jgi:hypothetical protein
MSSSEPIDQRPQRALYQSSELLFRKIKAATPVKHQVAVHVRPEIHGDFPGVILLELTLFMEITSTRNFFMRGTSLMGFQRPVLFQTPKKL